MKHYRILILSAIVMLGFTACEKDEIAGNDNVAPGKLTQLDARPSHGGALISYKLPEEGDLDFVRADYTNSLGQAMTKVCSAYENEIQIDGLNEVEPVTITLKVVDRYKNESEPISFSITPKESHIHLINRSLRLEPSFGGVKILWNNETGMPAFTKVSYADHKTGNMVSEYFSSKGAENSVNVKGLDTLGTEFFVQVEDFYGNKTAEESKGSFKPLFERKIDKSKWRLISQLSIDGNAWEGRTENVWDDVIDTKESNADNSYCIITRNDNGGQLNYPLDIVIDMGEAVQINRFTLWQRAFWYGNDQNYYYYQTGNAKAFEIYTSNDLSTWNAHGRYDIGDPKLEDGSVPQEAIQAAIDGHEFSLPEATESFRYLKLSIVENYGSEAEVNLSELTLYGG